MSKWYEFEVELAVLVEAETPKEAAEKLNSRGLRHPDVEFDKSQEVYANEAYAYEVSDE